MLRYLFSLTLMSALIGGAAVLALSGADEARGDVGGVYSNVPVFTPGQVVNITVTAEDDDGNLFITSNLAGSELTVINCSGIGADQQAGECDGSGLSAVTGQGSEQVRIDTNTLDEDTDTELLTIALTLIADCDQEVAVTVSGDQPGNVGPDDVTINCAPPTPTPTPSPTPSPTAEPTQTSTPVPDVKATEEVPAPPAAPVDSAGSSTVITPPNTGDAGLR